jgi:hypothetical protein
VSLVVAVVALVINMSSLVRRPRIVAEWGEVADDHGGPREGLSIIVTARRRAIEVDEIGVVILPERTRQDTAVAGSNSRAMGPWSPGV